MGNPHKGELSFTLHQPSPVAFDHGGKTYKLVFSANALCEMENLTGQPAIAAFADMGDPAKARITTLRAALWAALKDNHPDLPLYRAGEIITGIGMAQASKLIGEAFALAFPSPGGDRPLADQSS
jgi:hypothetical protein